MVSFSAAVFQSGTQQTEVEFLICSKGLRVASLTGDKGYDQKSVYKGIRNRSENATVIIHPRSNAVISGKKKWTQRDMHVHRIRTDGVYEWRRESGYYQQTKVENTFYRYKTTIGRRLRARTEESREVEAKIACKILNRFLELGKAKSERIA